MRRGVVVAALGCAQSLAWGSSYYLPAVMADPIAAGLHLPRAWFFAIFSGALLLSGLLGPAAGRAIDRRGGRDILAMSNLMFAAGLLILGAATGLSGLAASWTMLGLGMGFGLYEAAFATLAALYGRDARAPITGVTLIGGFASTIGWPLSNYLTAWLGWRGACVVWAGLHLGVGLPLNRFLIPRSPAHVVSRAVEREPVRASRAMIILAGVFAACWFVSTAMAAHLPRLLQALGASRPTAIAASSLVGPAQVAARLLEYGFLHRFPPLVSARLAAVLHPIGAGLIAVLGAPAAFLFALLHGSGNGLLTIARGTVPLALFGAGGYGLRTGLLAAPARILQGGAPLLFGLVLDREGPGAALLLSSALTLGSFGALLLLRSGQGSLAGS
jgi:MFS family permease